MKTLRFGISKTDHEWTSLENIIKTRRNGKPAQKGSGISNFLYVEINKLFKVRTKNCPTDRAVRTRKEFEIIVGDSIAEQIECEANELGITVGELIAKKIVDRHVEPNAITL